MLLPEIAVYRLACLYAIAHLKDTRALKDAYGRLCEVYDFHSELENPVAADHPAANVLKKHPAVRKAAAAPLVLSE